jgi:hypothetical protein
MPTHHQAAPILACLIALLGVAACTPVRADPPTVPPAGTAPSSQGVGVAATRDSASPAGGTTSAVSTAAPTMSPAAPVPAAAAVALWPPTAPPGQPGYLAAGSDPGVLPGPVLIADKGNNRLLVVDPHGRVVWQWPRPGDLAAGQSFVIPDDAFFTPDGKDIIATQEDDFVVTEIDIATRRIVWRYGHPGVPGSSPGYLWNPDDAMLLPDGFIVAADIKNCRLLELRPGLPAPASTWGRVGQCRHSPPRTFGSPNGVFPLPGGRFLVTEINRDWVDEIDLAGHVFWSVHPPQVGYPSDSNQYKPGEYLTVDYSNPGQVVIFDRTGRTLWRWNPSAGAGKLNHPSLAVALPNGDILLNDDRNNRVIVIDPVKNRIVWQYGHTGAAGSAPGYLRTPDGLDPAPPWSYADGVS